MSTVGGIAGWSYGTIENCSVSGSVSGSGSDGYTGSGAGGVVGSQWGGSITGCSSSATVKGVTIAGGIAGDASGASLTGCYATGSVSVANNTENVALAGGVVGANGGGTLTACYATGSVSGSGSGTIYVGGVTGSNTEGTLTACYHANGTVSGPDGTTGGVTGRNYDANVGAPVITACYWQNNQGQGIGFNQAGTTDGTTQVADGNWLGAKDAMNAALQSAGSEWHYVLNGALPTLE